MGAEDWIINKSFDKNRILRWGMRITVIAENTNRMPRWGMGIIVIVEVINRMPLWGI
jgi:hypothetical protein